MLTDPLQLEAAADFIRCEASRGRGSIRSLCQAHAPAFGLTPAKLESLTRTTGCTDPTRLEWKFRENHDCETEAEILGAQMQDQAALNGFHAAGREQDDGASSVTGVTPAEIVRQILSLIAPTLTERKWTWGKERRMHLANDDRVDRYRGPGHVIHGDQTIMWTRGAVLVWRGESLSHIFPESRCRFLTRRGASGSRYRVMAYKTWEPTDTPNDRAVANAASALIRQFFPGGLDDARQSDIGRSRGVSRQAVHYHEKKLAQRLAALAAARGKS